MLETISIDAYNFKTNEIMLWAFLFFSFSNHFQIFSPGCSSVSWRFGSLAAPNFPYNLEIVMKITLDHRYFPLATYYLLYGKGERRLCPLLKL